MKIILYKEWLDLKNKLLELLIITVFFVILGVYSKNTTILFPILICNININNTFNPLTLLLCNPDARECTNIFITEQ